MTSSTPYTISESPPPELLAELDAAAQALDELTSRAAELTLAMDEQAAEAPNRAGRGRGGAAADAAAALRPVGVARLR